MRWEDNKLVKYITVILYTILLISVSEFYLIKRNNSAGSINFKKYIKDNIKYILATVIVVVVILTMEIRYLSNNGIEQLELILRWSTIIWGVFLAARIDYKELKIPNLIILVLLGLRCVFLIYELLVNAEFAKLVVVPPLLGAVIGGVVMLVAMLVSRKGIGMGDVKLFIVIGAFVGSTEIFATMFYTMIVAAGFCIVLLLTKKAKLKDSIPMAPFSFLGLAIEYGLLLYGG